MLVLVAVTLIITALGVIFAIAATVLALLGFFGYRELSTKIVARAEKVVQDALAKYPTPQQLKDDLFARLKPDPFAPISLLESSTDAAESLVQGEHPHTPISAPYPGEEKRGHADNADDPERPAGSGH